MFGSFEFWLYEHQVLTDCMGQTIDGYTKKCDILSEFCDGGNCYCDTVRGIIK